MQKYALFIHGVNFLIKDSDNDAPKLLGFYVTAYVEAESTDEAEQKAVSEIRTAQSLTTILNAKDDSPKVFVEEIAEYLVWPDDVRIPLSRFVFYDDPDAKWKLSKKTAVQL